MVNKAVKVHLEAFHFAAEAKELVIPKLVYILVDHILLCDDFSGNILIWPFSSGEVIVLPKPLSQLAAHLAQVEGGLILTDAHAEAGIVVALEHKLLRQRGKVDFVRAVPHAEQRNQILRADFSRDIFPHAVFVHHHGVFRPPVVDLQPLELFVEGLRRIQMQRRAHQRLKFPLQIVSVRHAVIQPQRRVDHKAVRAVRTVFFELF